MFVLYAICIFHVALGAIATPPAWWVWREARRDFDALKAGRDRARAGRREQWERRRDEGADEDHPLDPEETEMDITAGLRRRNSLGIFVGQVVYMLTGMIMLGLVVQYEHSQDARWAFAVLLFIATVRSIVVQVDLSILSFMSWRDRRRLARLQLSAIQDDDV